MSPDGEMRPALANLIITIDGTAGSGKSTAARLLAQRLGMPYLDTGAMYRVVTLAALQKGLSFDDCPALARLAETIDFEVDTDPAVECVRLGGVDVTQSIRSMPVNENTKHVAGCAPVRAELVRRQQAIGARLRRLVTEGRDQGTVAFPAAPAKFYVDAPLDIRANRRSEELSRRALSHDPAEVRQNLAERDSTDAGRSVGPLLRPADAWEIDSSGLDSAGVVARMIAMLESRGLLRPAPASTVG